ncbi:extracellular solute-binding protein [Devosia aquimaris]|uniref:extracellular solute-binding protein n=1 Tax=Devosia aquimaris TaxID=2866214 RepID=UPI001CD0F5C2|nr:extracellular solute-binding protein [Devosia sp. CJK-A8-3]
MVMKRREFLKGTAAIGLGGVAAGLMGRTALAAEGTLDIFFNSDTNVVEFWGSAIKPAFEAANPGTTLNLVSGGGGASMNALAERAFAALQSGTDPQIDMMEAIGPYHPEGAIEAGLWDDFSTLNLSNMSKVNPAVIDNQWSLPYRGSQVVMMYNSEKVPTPPKTFEELVAWIKANPGQFAYARPDLGDSGACFIERALQEVMGRDESLFTNENYTPEYAEPMFAKLWVLLNDIAPSLYKGGEYTGGNTPSIQLLASGVISMTIAWSDMALVAMNEGVVPETTAVAQLQDLAFIGGYSSVLVPTNAANHEMSLKLADFLISPEVQNKVVTDLGGFPSINWSEMSPELQAKFANVATTSIPTFPGPWEPALFDGWYRNVASNLTRS